MLRPIDLRTAKAVLRDRRSDDWSEGYPQEGDRQLCELFVGLALQGAAGREQDSELFSPHQVILDHLVVGTISCHRPPGPDGTVEIGYGLAPEWRGRGVATTALARLSERLLAAGVRTIVARTDMDNLASQGVLRRCGYRLTGEGDDGSILWELPGASR